MAKPKKERPGRQTATQRRATLPDADKAAGRRPSLDSPARRRWILLGILAIASFLRLYQLDSLPAGLNHDVAMNGNNALENIELRHLSLFYPENSGREGLFINVQTAFVGLLGNTPLALRLPAALFGLLTIWGIYCLAAELFTARVALIAAFFSATSFWHIVFSRAGLRAISAPCFLVWSLYFLFSGFDRAREKKPWTGRVLLAGALYGMGFHTYIAYRVTPLLAAAILLFEAWRSRKEKWMARYLKAAGAFGAAAIVLAAPLALYFLRNPGAFSQRTGGISVFGTAHPLEEAMSNTSKMLWMFFTEGDSNWGHNYAGAAELFWPVALFFLIGVLVSLRMARAEWRSASARHTLLLGWIAVGCLPAVLSHDAMPHALRSILMIPPTFILAAIGLDCVYRYGAPKVPKTAWMAAGIVLAVVLCVQPYHMYFDLWSAHPNVMAWSDAAVASVAEQVNAMPAEQPKYVAIDAGGYLEKNVPIQAQTLMYLARAYTARQQERIQIRYLSPWNYRPIVPVTGMNFCQAVNASVPAGQQVFCLQTAR